MVGGGGRGLIFVPAGYFPDCCSRMLELSGFFRTVLPECKNEDKGKDSEEDGF